VTARRPRTSCACWGVTQSSAVRAAALKRAPTNTTYRLPPTVPPTSAHTSARHAAHRRTPRGQRCAASTCSRLYLARVLRVGARHASPRAHINLMKLWKREIHIVLYRSRAIVVATGYEIHVPRPSRIVPVCRRSSPVGHIYVTSESHSAGGACSTRGAIVRVARVVAGGITWPLSLMPSSSSRHSELGRLLGLAEVRHELRVLGLADVVEKRCRAAATRLQVGREPHAWGEAILAIATTRRYSF